MIEQGSFGINRNSTLGSNVARHILPQVGLGIDISLFQEKESIGLTISPREGASLQTQEKEDLSLEDSSSFWIDKEELILKSPVNGAPINYVPFSDVFRVLKDGASKIYSINTLFSGKPEKWNVETHVKEVLK